MKSVTFIAIFGFLLIVANTNNFMSHLFFGDENEPLNIEKLLEAAKKH